MRIFRSSAILGLLVAAFMWIAGIASACGGGGGYQPPPPCHQTQDCTTPTSPQPPTVVKHHKKVENHCHVRFIIHTTVTHVWKWNTKLCKWVECKIVNRTVTVRHHATHCHGSHGGKRAPTPGGGTTTTCKVDKTPVPCKSTS